jgi:predicted site-specific integrase-resolvase
MTSDPILSGYITETELAEQLGVVLRTLRYWRQEGIGPPVTWVGRKPMFRVDAVRGWLQSREQRMPRERARVSCKPNTEHDTAAA